MAHNDEWCVFCEDKIKAVTVVSPSGKEYDICKHCATLSPYRESIKTGGNDQ